MLRWNESFQKILENYIEKHERGEIEGMYEDIPIEVYHHPAMPGFSKTDLEVASRSLQHLITYKAKRALQYNDPAAKEKRSLVIGSAFHDSIFTPDRYVDVYAIEPLEPEVPESINRRTKIGKEEYKLWLETVRTPWENEVLLPFQREKVAITTDELEMLSNMKVSADGHETFQAIIKPAVKEVTIFYRDPKTGILLKTRPDALDVEGRVCLDAKTTEDARPAAFRKTIANYKYDMQSAMQVDGSKTILGVQPDFVFSAHEKEEPFGIMLYRFDDACLDVGRTLVNNVLSYLNTVLQDRSVPRGYPTDIVSIGLPAYAFDINSR